jgi:drug/metabolite transporter (DMT)-like permease
MWRIWVAALLWGFNWPAVKIMLETSGPWTLRAAGLSCGAAILLAVTRLAGQSLKIARKDWLTIAVAGLLNVAGFNIFAVFAQLSMPTSRAAILTFTMPLWAAVFSWVFLGETLDRLRSVSLALGAVGIGVLSVPFWPIVQAGGLPFGLVYVLGAAISWALGTVWLKARPVTADPLATTAWQVLIASAVCSAGMLAFEVPRLDLSRPEAAVAPASTAAIGTLLIPIFGVIGSIALLGDWPTPLDVAGLVLILTAVAVDQILRARH